MPFKLRGSRGRSCAITIEEEEAEREKENQLQIHEFLQLLDKITKQRNITPEDVEEIRCIFKNNRKLLNYQHCKDNKLRSVLHVVKYNIKLKYDVKQMVVNTIVDMGYDLYKFSEDNFIGDNSHALFFTAAKGDYALLEKIVDYFKTTGNESKLHDTREGDTVLSFMIKFGNYTEENFIKCFGHLVKQNIDFRRIDYFKNNSEDVVKKEKNFLGRIGSTIDENILNTIEVVLKNTNTDANDNGPLYNKHQLFHSILKNDKNFDSILAQNLPLIDSDDGENTLLQLAIIKNNVEITKHLLLNGANPNRTVKGRNEEVPLILAAKLNRDDIFQQILQSHDLQITNNVFIKFVVEKIKPKFFSCLLESNNLNVDYQYRGKTVLFYAIRRKNKKAIQSILQRGGRLDDNSLSSINPKDLEEYLNSCVKFDSFQDDMGENDYKAFLVFDFFIKSTDFSGVDNNENDDTESLIRRSKPKSEIEQIQRIGSCKRLEHLLEHPLIYIFILLKWNCTLIYYYIFVLLKFFFCTCIVYLMYTSSLNPVVLSFILIIQFFLVYFNFSEFKLEFRRYTLHFVVEILLFLLLITIYILILINKSDTLIAVNEVSAFVIILTSLSMLLTLGYHMNLSKWMAMAKRVFKNFGILLLFFICPILAFAIAFQILLPFSNQNVPPTKENGQENEDFVYLPRAIFRTFIMLSGDIGDKKFSLLGGYILFLLFAIGMAIILMNFWTGVAVSDIKEIEEKSVVVAFNNVIVFIQTVEKLYKLFVYKLLKKLPPRWKNSIFSNLPLPFLEYKVKMKRKKKSKFYYGIDLFINDENHFRSNTHFKSLRLTNEIVSKIKSLNDEKDLNVAKTLKMLTDEINKIDEVCKRILLYENHFKKIEQLLESTESRRENKK